MEKKFKIHIHIISVKIHLISHITTYDNSHSKRKFNKCVIRCTFQLVIVLTFIAYTLNSIYLNAIRIIIIPIHARKKIRMQEKFEKST